MTKSSPSSLSAKPPLDDRDGYIWMDGKMLPWRTANVHFVTHALHYATAVFEGERIYNGSVFKSRQHSERLHRSANMVYLPVHYDVDQLEHIKYELIAANKLKNGYMRMLAWRGSEQLGVDASRASPRLGIAAWEWSNYFDTDQLAQGISLHTSQWRRPHPNSAPVFSKATSLYNVCAMARHEAAALGFTDALMLDYEGYVAEASVANFFAVQDGVIHTPIADRFLNGITRQTIIELAQQLGIELIERRIRPEEMSGFQEVFLTGSATEITPVGKIDDLLYKPSAITERIRDAFADLTQGKNL
jgi:branched-chain amino acid aminotransferase